MNLGGDRNIDPKKEAEVQPAVVAQSPVDSNQDQPTLEVDAYSTLVKQLRSVRLLNDASKLLARKEAAEALIPKMESEASTALQIRDSATAPLERLAYAQRAKEAEDKVAKLRDSIKAIEARAVELAEGLAS